MILVSRLVHTLMGYLFSGNYYNGMHYALANVGCSVNAHVLILRNGLNNTTTSHTCCETGPESYGSDTDSRVAYNKLSGQWRPVNSVHNYH